MKSWLLIAVAICMPGGGILALLMWLLNRWRARQDAALTIRPLGPEHYRFTGHDEALEARARARREIAAALAKRSALIASGSTSHSVLKMAKKA